MRVTAKQFTRTIENHMGRVHVSTPEAFVVQDIYAAIERSLKQHPDWSMGQSTKDAIVRYALKCHADNRALYARVMRGHVK